MPKILHLASDEKFIDAANYLYETAFPNSNTFIIILPKFKNYKIKYVSKKENYIFYHNNKKTLINVLELIDKHDLIVLHGYDFFKSQIVNNRQNAVYNYILWGGELYNRHHLLKNSLYGKKTSATLQKKTLFKDVFRPFAHLLKYKVFNIYNFQFKTLSKINYCSILHKEDYSLFIDKGIIKKTTKWLKFTYYPIEFIFGENNDLKVNNNNILLGNSASPTNNHIEAIDLLKNINLQNRKIITPLSYGNMKYASKIIKYGEENLSNNFHYLKDFMPLQEYNKTIQSCGIVIMNHYRQQAVGNILANLWMGAKVFLDKRNTFYHYLKRIGCYVYLIDDLINDNLENLNNTQIEHNKSILLKEIGTETIVNTLKNDIQKIAEL